MPRALAVHLTGIAVLAGLTAFVLAQVGDAAPAANRWAAAGVTAAYVAAWFAMLVLAGRGRDDVRAKRIRRRNTRLVGWGGALTIVACTFLIGPYVEPQLRLVVILYQLGAVSMQVMGSIRRPPDSGRPGLEPLLIPISISLFYLLHWDRYSPAMIVFGLAHGYVSLTLRNILQGAVDRAEAARAAAEAALIEVAAERDAKTRFLTSASHDLGQPLQAARLFFDQAIRSPDPLQRAKAASKVSWAFDATEQLLHRMLDHLRLESGAVEPQIGRVPLGPLVARIAEMNEPAARLAGVSLHVLSSRLAAAADAALVERALGNLVGNAIRHAKARRVLVGVRRQGERVRLWVIDDGMGVREADLQQLFDDYVQGSDHGEEIRGGFGLGLASARRMAGLMGGAVGLDRSWTHGSAFWLELNVAAAKAG